MTSPLDETVDRITCWGVGERCSHLRVYLSTSRCAATTGRRDFEFLKHIAT